eukprot:TRINITY_DN97_c0_g2_i1.p1 TRINITY_DN97_c0_g2~~TRINITY_DN97_c0_g2_i1.p1  ORF type:complete len:1884 (+),score=563.96 TRINITY_DN97_c0_g2_i1:67-5652(+)
MAGASYVTTTQSTAPWKKPERVNFTLWDPDEIKAGSVCEIRETTCHVNGAPVANSCHDLRLGTTEYDQLCETCNMDLNDCPGHWGHIQLARPMLHMGYTKTVVQVLKVVCFHCSLIKLDPRDPKYKEAASKRRPQHRLREFIKACGSKAVCDASCGPTADEDPSVTKPDHIGCGKPQPRVWNEPQSFRLWQEYRQANVDVDNAERKSMLLPEDVRRVLCGIRPDQLEALGFSERNRPEWMVLTVLPVCPPACRPAITMDAVTKTEDNITYMYGKVLQFNNRLRTLVRQQAAESVCNDIADLVQYHIATMMDNEKNGIPRAKLRNGQLIKSIRERLKGKNGRVRSNLMGKRVDFSARTVIGGDSQLGMDEVGVPLSIASNMTHPERVSLWNIEQMRMLVANGPDKYPGAKYVIRDDGQRINLAMAKRRADLTLQPGYIVERHVLTNDVVLFNRQPTLHRMSMMGHRARVMPFSTFRLNLSATSPYNADFDGDEMNLHVPQSVLSKAEMQEFMMVPKMIISPKSNAPVMGLVQDTLLGVHLLTRRSTFFDKHFLMNAVMCCPIMPAVIPQPAILKPKPLWTGKQLFSLLLPSVNFVGKSNDDPDTEPFGSDMPIADTKVRIENGQLLHGIIDKRSVGASENSLVHVLYNEFNPDWARDLINGVQRVTAYYLVVYGFTVGVQDTVADPATKKQIAQIIRRSYDAVDKLCSQAQGGLKREPGKTVKETFESKINKILNETREDAGKRAQRSLSRSNNFKVMVSAGSKGSFLNISQITAVVGQQNVGGKRIPYGFRKRTLPHFTQDDYGPEARGFVQNSYLEGLTPSEFVCHMSGGREGLIDTACKTAETGYIQRKLVKALEDVYAAYDCTVRNSQGNIVQFLYGEEGWDSTKMESFKPLPLIDDNNRQMEKKYKHEYEGETDDWGTGVMQPSTLESIFQDTEAARVMNEEFEQIKQDRGWLRDTFAPDGHVPFVNSKDGIKLPVNLHRLIANAKIQFAIKSGASTDLSTLQVIRGLRSLLEDMIGSRGHGEFQRLRNEKGVKLWSVMLRAVFASKRVVWEYRLTSRAFHWVLGELRARYLAALVPPGEMVGVIAAQSIGEPATQMTLNTFHFAGVASKNVTLGVPRLKQLINVVKNPPMQGLSVCLKPGLRDNQVDAKRAQTVIEYLTLRQITSKVEIWYDPDPAESVLPQDQSILDLDWAMDVRGPEEQEELREIKCELSPWIIRLELNRREYINFELTMAEIANKIRDVFPGTPYIDGSKTVMKDNFRVEVSDDNADVPVVRLRYYSPQERRKTEAALESAEQEFDDPQSDMVDFLKSMENDILDRVHLRGIYGIKKVFMSPTERKQNNVRVEYDPETGEKEFKTEWTLDTDGTNMLRVMALDEVDHTRTVSTNITEVLTCLGIEACRRSLQKSLFHVYNAYGIYINARHSSVLCDVMCNRGYLMAINRHGINRQEVGPLMRCSYEETVEVLLQASAFGESDRLTGVSSSIMLGQPIKGGTTLCSILLDEDHLRRHEYLPPSAIRMQSKLITIAKDEGITTSGEFEAPSFPEPFDIDTGGLDVLGADERASPASLYSSRPSFAGSIEVASVQRDEPDVEEPAEAGYFDAGFENRGDDDQAVSAASPEAGDDLWSVSGGMTSRSAASHRAPSAGSLHTLGTGSATPAVAPEPQYVPSRRGTDEVGSVSFFLSSAGGSTPVGGSVPSARDSSLHSEESGRLYGVAGERQYGGFSPAPAAAALGDTGLSPKFAYFGTQEGSDSLSPSVGSGSHRVSTAASDSIPATVGLAGAGRSLSPRSGGTSVFSDSFSPAVGVEAAAAAAVQPTGDRGSEGEGGAAPSELSWTTLGEYALGDDYMEDDDEAAQ